MQRVVGPNASRADETDAIAHLDSCVFVDLPEFAELGDDVWSRMRARLVTDNLDIDGIELAAWGLTCRFVEVVAKVGAFRHRAGHLALARRMLFTGIFLPALRARWQAERAAAVLDPTRPVRPLGLTDLQTTAFAEVFPHLEVGTSLNPPVSEPHSGGRGTRRTSVFGSAVHASLAAFRSRRSRRQRLRSMSDSVGGGGKWLAVYVGHRIHDRILGRAVQILRAQGWSIVRVDMSHSASLAPPHEYEADLCVAKADFRRSDAVGWLAAFRLLRANKELRRTVSAFCAEHGIAPYQSALLTALLRLVALTVPAELDLHEAILSAVRPNAILTLQETDLSVEAVALQAAHHGIPSVNVQHGVILPIPLRADFRFDAFCVFGEAFGEALRQMGTAEDRIVVVGDLRLDVSADEAREVPHREDREVLDIPEGRPTVVYAAQYPNYRLSRATLYESFKATVRGTAGAGAHLILKRHPAAGGTDGLYDRVLAEHPDADVSVVVDYPLLDLIRGADAVALHSSTVGFEAVAMGKPLLVVNPMGTPEVPFVAEGVARRARDAAEVQGWVAGLPLSDLADDATLARFVERYSYELDGLAAERLAAVVDALAGR